MLKNALLTCVLLAVLCGGACAQTVAGNSDELAALRAQVAQQRQRIAELEKSMKDQFGEPRQTEDSTRREGSCPVAGAWDRALAKLRKMEPTTLIGWVWFVIGFGGEFIFFLRFVVQWWASEKRKMTVVPMAFWHLSLIGTGLVLAYALYRIDPVFILAYSLNIFLYVRNLIIAKRQPAQAALMEKEAE